MFNKGSNKSTGSLSKMFSSAKRSLVALFILLTKFLVWLNGKHFKLFSSGRISSQLPRPFEHGTVMFRHRDVLVR